MKKLFITSEISFDTLDDAIRNHAENCTEKEFNKFALNVLGIFLYRCENIGCLEDFKCKAIKLINREP
jgi:hypothetical protein